MASLDFIGCALLTGRLPRMAGGKTFAGGRGAQGQITGPFLPSAPGGVDADKMSDEAAAAVAEVSRTANGALRVKLHDKHAALVSIGRYLGMFDDKVKVDAV
jgi:hypothetical protein